jgi:hypothetical protein
MAFTSWIQSLKRGPGRDGRRRHRRQRTGSVTRRRSFLPRVEMLEDRTLLSNFFTAATASDLIADINKANLAGGSNTIALVAHKTFNLTAVNNAVSAPNRTAPPLHSVRSTGSPPSFHRRPCDPASLPILTL